MTKAGEVRWVRARTRPVLDASGKVAHVWGASQRISLKINLRRTRAENTKRSSSYSASPHRLELVGLSHEENLGMGWAKVIHPDDRAYVTELWATAVRGREFQSDFCLLTKKGELRWVTGRAVPLRADDGTLLGHSGNMINR